MKKNLVLVMVFALMLGMVCMAACGDKKTEEAKVKEPKASITIAAAASLENAFTKDLIPAFEKKHPTIKVTGTYDASGKLQMQIEEGASIDIFFSAATKQMDALTGKDLIDKKSESKLLKNDVVLIKSKGGKTDKIKKYKDITKANTIAIGDPASVPAGQYAKQSFEKLGIWDALQSKKISYGTNVTEVLNWVAEGSVDVGVVYRSDAMSMPEKVEIIDVAPKDAVEPAVYPIGIVKASKNQKASKIFIDFLKSDEAGKIFEKYGFKADK